MPFCRECGKQVEDDWVSCPFCSQPIGPPASAMLGVQDSVVMGDINISKSGEEPTSCSNCGAAGSVKLACVDCKEHCTCDRCDIEYLTDLFSWPYELTWEEDSGVKFDRTISPKAKIRCKSCYQKFAESKCTKKCVHCWRKFDDYTNEEDDIDSCYRCRSLNKSIIRWKDTPGLVGKEIGEFASRKYHRREQEMIEQEAENERIMTQLKKEDAEQREASIEKFSNKLAELNAEHERRMALIEEGTFRRITTDDDEIGVGDWIGLEVDGKEFFGEIIEFDDDKYTVLIEDEDGYEVTGNQSDMFFHEDDD